MLQQISVTNNTWVALGDALLLDEVLYGNQRLHPEVSPDVNAARRMACTCIWVVVAVT
jgi:hypothetical protein